VLTAGITLGSSGTAALSPPGSGPRLPLLDSVAPEEQSRGRSAAESVRCLEVAISSGGSCAPNRPRPPADIEDYASAVSTSQNTNPSRCTISPTWQATGALKMGPA